MAITTVANGGLTRQQKRFVKEFLVDGNGQQAAIRAGYSIKSRASGAAVRLLSYPLVAKAVAEGNKELFDGLGASADMVARELEILAMSNIADYRITRNGDVALSEYADYDAMRAVKTVKKKAVYRDGEMVECTTEITLHDKNRALENCGRRLGMFQDKIKHEHSGEVAIKVVGGIDMDVVLGRKPGIPADRLDEIAERSRNGTLIEHEPQAEPPPATNGKANGKPSKSKKKPK